MNLDGKPKVGQALPWMLATPFIFSKKRTAMTSSGRLKLALSRGSRFRNAEILRRRHWLESMARTPFEKAAAQFYAFTNPQQDPQCADPNQRRFLFRCFQVTLFAKTLLERAKKTFPQAGTSQPTWWLFSAAIHLVAAERMILEFILSKSDGKRIVLGTKEYYPPRKPGDEQNLPTVSLDVFEMAAQDSFRWEERFDAWLDAASKSFGYRMIGECDWSAEVHGSEEKAGGQKGRTEAPPLSETPPPKLLGKLFQLDPALGGLLLADTIRLLTKVGNKAMSELHQSEAMKLVERLGAKGATKLPHDELTKVVGQLAKTAKSKLLRSELTKLVKEIGNPSSEKLQCGLKDLVGRLGPAATTEFIQAAAGSNLATSGGDLEFNTWLLEIKPLIKSNSWRYTDIVRIARVKFRSKPDLLKTFVNLLNAADNLRRRMKDLGLESVVKGPGRPKHGEGLTSNLLTPPAWMASRIKSIGIPKGAWLCGDGLLHWS